MSNQGTIRLKVTNGAPAIEKLWNGRFKLEFFCDNNSPKEDWYYENVSALLPEYGILQTTNFGSGVSEDWEAIPDSVYPDMRLVLAEYPYNVRAGKHYVKLTYETLTASWVEEKAEDTDYELNGLKRVSRTFVALPGTVYDKVIGTSTIDSGGTTLYLGSFKIEKTEAKWGLTEVWLEAGTLSETLDNVGSQKAKVIETIGADPSTPSGYSLASKQESDFEGFQTNRFTFLKPSILSLQQKFNDGLKQVSVQAFGMTATAVSSELSEVTTNHQLISQVESDYKGIKTSTFQYQIDESITEDYELNGLKSLSITELSSTNFTARDIGVVGVTATPQAGLYLGAQDIDNGGAIKVRESVWFEAGTLNVQRVSESEGVYKVTTTFLAVEGSVVGPIIARTINDSSGLKTITVVSMQDSSGSSLVAVGSQPIASHSVLNEFTHPGVVTISNTTLSGTGSTYTFKAKDFSLKPPCVSKVPATIKVSFKDSGSIAYTSSGGLWNPTTWAEGSSRGIAWNYLPFSISRGFRGYRINSAATNSYAATATTTPKEYDMISGKRIFSETSYAIQVSGGPANPSGSEYTLDYGVSLAFEDVNGVAYYKHREVVATIPST